MDEKNQLQELALGKNQLKANNITLSSKCSAMVT
jgi:hypothetical protein